MGHAPASAHGLRGAAGGLLLFGALAWVAHGQPLKIPDFRSEPPRAAVSPGEKCDRCGLIVSIREVRVSRPVPVPGAFQNDPLDHGPGSTVLVGAVIALPMGESKEKPFVGGVGTPEMRERFSETAYDIRIRLDDGAETLVQRRDGADFRVGDRVRVQGIQLELLAP